MPYWTKLYAPGERKGNRFYVARGGDTDAKEEYEYSTRTTDKSLAQERAAVFHARWLGDRTPGDDAEDVTFAQAVAYYKIAATPKPYDITRLDALTAEIGHRMVRSITSGEVIVLAEKMRPLATHTNETRNRDVVTMISAVMKVAAERKWAPEQKFKRFKVPKHSTRRPAKDADLRKLLDRLDLECAEARALLARPMPKVADRRKLMQVVAARNNARIRVQATPYRRALLLLLYEVGMRITDLVTLNDQRLELELARFWTLISKTQTPKYTEISVDLVVELANLPRMSDGRVFPWGDRHAVYRWLTPLCDRAEVTYTPHMSRHAMATAFKLMGMSDDDIARHHDWADARSVARYTHSAPARTEGRTAAALLAKPAAAPTATAAVAGRPKWR
jgi:integrase